MRLYFRLAWRNIWRQKRRTIITVAAMGVGVAFCLASIALTDGLFADSFDVMVRQNLGHVQIHAPKFPKQRALYETITDAHQTLAALDAEPQVAGASGRVFGYGLLALGDKSAAGQLMGIEPQREQKVTALERKLVQGTYLDTDPSKQILLGAGLAETLKAKIGDEVVVVAQAVDGSLGNELFRVQGLFKTGSVALDRTGAVVHLKDLQSLLVLEDQLHEIALLAMRDEEAAPLAARLKEPLGGRNLLVRTWAQVNPELAKMLETQSMSAWIILFFIFSVAALGVLNTMLMSVLERTRELGVLRALGLPPRQMVLLVLCESAILATVAGLAGLALGGLLDLGLVTVGLDLSRFIGDFSFAGIAFSPVLHGVVRLEGIVATLIGLITVTLLASLWPALRAARLKPIEAMRQE
jgi:ABC-type lipoprotein release transport system permease subunit